MSATEPSRRSSGRRHRELRARALELDARYGPDTSTPIYVFDDGWTLRRIDRLPDQRREGHLMRHCLRIKNRPRDENCYSLRDADNIPHVTASAWATDTAAEPGFPGLGTSVMPLFRHFGFLKGRFSCFMVEGRQKGWVADHHRERLLAFAQRPCATLPPFPDGPMHRVDALIFASFGREYTSPGAHAKLKRIVSRELMSARAAADRG